MRANRRTTILVATACAMLLALAGPVAPVGAADTGTIAGTVTDEHTGSPAAAMVFLYRVNSTGGNPLVTTVRADASGHYEFTGLSPSTTYRVRFANAADPWFSEYWCSTCDDAQFSTSSDLHVNVTADSTTTIDEAIWPESYVEGTITDEDSGDQLQYYNVYVDDVRVDFTDAAGFYSFIRDSRDGPLVMMYRPGPNVYEYEWWDDADSEAAATPIDVQPGVTYTADVQVKATLVRYNFEVRDALTGSLITDAKYRAVRDDGWEQTKFAYQDLVPTASNPISTIDDSWRFQFFDGAGTYEVEWYEDSATYTGATWVSEPVAGTYVITAYLLPKGAVIDAELSGTATDPSGPMVGAHVAAWDDTDTLVGVTQTGADGSYSLTLDPGDYTIRVIDPVTGARQFHDGSARYPWAQPPLTLPAGPTTVDFTIAEITGTATGQGVGALSGVEVEAWDATTGERLDIIRTATDGTYSLWIRPGTDVKVRFRDAVAPGTWTQEFHDGSMWWYQASTLPIAAGTTTLNAELTP